MCDYEVTTLLAAGTTTNGDLLGGVNDFFDSGTWLLVRNLSFLFLAVFWAATVYWVYKDARRRIEDPWLVAMATILGAVPPFLGPIIYMFFRPPEYLEDVRERGLEIRAIGGNPFAAVRNGIPVNAYIVAAMFAGGALAGLAAVEQLTASQLRLNPGLSPGFGYLGFLISWLAGHNPRLIIPMTFLGAIYYPWSRLSPIGWLQWLVLINPLVYMSEGFRLSLTKGVPHMPTLAIYGALLGFGALLSWLGIQGFKKRVLA